MATRRTFLGAAGATLFAFPLLSSLRACAPPPPATPTDTWSSLGLGTGNVIIDQPVLLDANQSCQSCRIVAGGVLVHKPNQHVALTVTSGNFIVEDNGRHTMRPSSRDWIHKLLFTGINEGNFVGGGMDPIASDRGVWCMEQGLLDWVGPDVTPWVRAAGTINAGATSAGVNTAPGGWRANDDMLIAPMRQNAEEFEIKSFASLTGNTVAWNGGCSFPHPKSPVLNDAGKTFGAELCNLTRNVRVEGTPTGRAHVFIRTTVPQNLSNVAFRYMGPNKPDGFNGTPAAVLGRYPLHFHHCMDGTRTSWIINCVVRDSGGHAFVSHASNGITYSKTVSHSVMGDAHWWDHLTQDPNAASDDIKYAQCVVSRCYPDGNEFKYTNAAFRADIGPNFGTTMDGCVAFGCPGSSGFRWEADIESVWNFKNNVAHSNGDAGAAVWQNDGEPHHIDDSFFYNNAGSGIGLGAYGNSYHINRTSCVGNGGPQIRISAVSDPSQGGQQWNDIYVDALGQTSCMEFPAGSPVGNGSGTLVKDSTFKNAAGRFLGLQLGADVHDGAAVVNVQNCNFSGSAPHTQVDPAVQGGAHFVVT